MTFRPLICITAISLSLLSSSCYNDDKLWQSVDRLDERVTNLESKIEGINSDIVTLRELVAGLSDGAVITNCTTTDYGYLLVLSDGRSIQVRNGADDKTVEWSSSDTYVAQVSSEGIVSALKPGTAIITAANNFHSSARATCMVTVTENSGVSGLTSGGKVIFTDRTLTIVGFEGQTFTIYNSAGMAVRSVVVSGDYSIRLDLPTGMYLLRNQNGSASMKIFIQ